MLDVDPAREDLLSPMLPPTLDPIASAKTAKLRYVGDDGPGIRRRRVGKGFTYVDENGAPVTDEGTLARIRALVIPPAWESVWICPHANGHIQATGRDVKGRKQYRYHARWREVRDESKYEKTIAFATALPTIRAAVERHLKLPGLPREKVLATIVRLLEVTCIRVGNEEYARKNRSFGLTTLRNRHVDISGSSVRFRFRGKSGKAHAIRLKDRRLARVIARCSELPGHELFQYVDDDGTTRSVESSDVNEYLKEISGADFTAKDFRTWVGTVLAVRALRELAPAENQAQATKSVKAAIKQVAQRLGNTVAVCRKCYIHPAVLDAYLDRDRESTLFVLKRAPDDATPSPALSNMAEKMADEGANEIVVTVEAPEDDLDDDERMTLAFLRSSAAGSDAAQAEALRKKLMRSLAGVKRAKAKAKKQAATAA